MAKGEQELKTGIGCILVGLAALLIPYLPVLAQDSDSQSITITMTGASEFSMIVTPADWKPAGEGQNVIPDQEYLSGSDWFTLKVDETSNCNVNTFIMGEDAICATAPSYKWTLSTDGTNGNKIYGLWFCISDDTTRGPNNDGYVPITKAQGEFWPYPNVGSYLTPGDTKKFGLKLKTPLPDFGSGPGYFSVGGASMKTSITISGVVV